MPKTQHTITVWLDINALAALVSTSLLVSELAEMVPDWRKQECDKVMEHLDTALNVLWASADVESKRQGVGHEKVS